MLAASQIDLVADRCARLGNIGEYGRCWAYLHRRATGLPVNLFDFAGPRAYTRLIPILHWAGRGRWHHG